MRKFLSALAAALAFSAAAVRAQQPSQPQQPAPPAQQSQPAPQATPQPTPAAQPQSQDGHEYAPLREHELSYKNWTYKTLAGDREVNLREWAAGKRLVLVVYFAPWCANWRMERPVVTRLYEKYKQHGFDVVAVSGYGTPDELQSHFSVRPAPFTVVVESDAREARTKTAHFRYRMQTGDSRKWGSPYNIFLAPAALRPAGDVLAERVWVVGGELIEAEVEQFIRERLGLPKDGDK